MKRGDRVTVEFTGRLVGDPHRGWSRYSLIRRHQRPARIRVDGYPGWIAVVPAGLVEREDEDASGVPGERGTG